MLTFLAHPMRKLLLVPFKIPMEIPAQLVKKLVLILMDV